MKNTPILIDGKNFGIALDFDKESDIVTYYTTSETNANVFIRKTTSKKSCIFSNKSLSYIPLYAQIVKIDDSSEIFGMRQRLEDLKLSVLPVISVKTLKHIINNKEQSSSYILITDRRDGATIEVLDTDLIFHYPTIHMDFYEKDDIILNSSVIAIKNSKSPNIKIGDEFIVINIEYNEVNASLDIIYIENNTISTSIHRKNLKLK
jgi:hypothetical protein